MKNGSGEVMSRKIFYIRTLVIIVTFCTIFVACENKTELVLSGTIEAKVYNVKAEITGKVKKVNANEGQEIAEGFTMVFIDDSIAQISLGQAEALVKAKIAKLGIITEGSRNQDINAATNNLLSLQEQYDIANNKYEYLKNQVANNQPLFEEGAISEDVLTQIKLEAENAKSIMESARYQVKAAEDKVSLLYEGALDSEVAMAQADLDSAFLTRDLALLTLDKYAIKATANGVISDLFVEKGDIVAVGNNIAQISDLSSKYVRAYIPQGKLHLISLNGEISLRMPAYPDEIFTGKITYIAKDANFTPKNIETIEAKEDTVFEIEIDISNIEKDAFPGMSIEVVIPFEKN